MAEQTWTLTDVDNGIHETELRVAPDDVGASWSVTQRTLRGGLSDGVSLVELDNGRMRIHVLPTRGMGIRKAEIDGDVLGWQSPVRGPVHPKFVPTFEPSGLGWLDGFDELLVRCGLESNGAPEFDEQGKLVYPLHGRIASRPAHFVEFAVDDAAETIMLRGIVEETRFHFQKLRLETTITTTFGSSEFTVNDTVENFGGTPAEMQMLYHLNIGEPLLREGDRFVAPVKSMRPRIPEETTTERWNEYGPAVAGQSEDCFYLEMHADAAGQTQVLLKDAEGSSGTAVAYDTKSLPYFTLWKNLVASADGYVTGLEPGTNCPNERSVEKAAGRIVNLESGGSWKTSLTVSRLANAEEVAEVEDAIRDFGGG